MLLNTVVLSALLAPTLVSAGLFPANGPVKMLDPIGWKKAMRRNETSLVAFVAPWCGHCQRLSPELSKAATSLAPLIPTYAVDCDAEENKRLCAEQDVKGFPTVKLFPRGRNLPPMTYESGERTASKIFQWASLRVPNKVSILKKLSGWIDEVSDKPRALLLTKEKKVPLLWKVLANTYSDYVVFAVIKDDDGVAAREIGHEGAKVVVVPAGEGRAVRYEGIPKLDPLRTFFVSIIKDPASLLAMLPPIAEPIVEEQEPLSTREEEETTPEEESEVDAAPIPEPESSPESEATVEVPDVEVPSPEPGSTSEEEVVVEEKEKEKRPTDEL